MGKCGDMYKVAKMAIEAHQAGGSAYFLLGQLEKVYLGACGACMIPQFAIDGDLAGQLANAYDMVLLSYKVTGWQPEFWFTRPGSVLPFWEEPVHSPAWNEYRGRVCGVPPHMIDFDFHKEQRHAAEQRPVD